ncbi:MAG: glutamate racemase, partial [Deltaproteobacteria bacterium]|nr:glutamate racemase [Deltaproteobacteria bacterium]
SGYGGLTIMKEIVGELPDYDFIYLGDNARAPYGTRSFETVYKYTTEAVRWLFDRGCHLVILACNTASSKALRTIQQNDLPKIDPSRRVLGVLRPVTEQAGSFTKAGHIGILGTVGTVESQSYPIEIRKFFPDITVTQEACPLWVSLVENGEHESPGADYFIKKHIDTLLRKDPEIDALILGCTHYPLLIDKIRRFLPPSVEVVSQGTLVARSLADYLERHREIEARCSRSGILSCLFKEKMPVFVHHLLNLFQGFVGEMFETALKFEVFPDGVILRLIIDRIFDAVLNLVEGKDICLNGHAGDLDGHLGGDAPSRRAARIYMEKSRPLCLFRLFDLSYKIIRKGDVRRCRIGDPVGNKGLDDSA